MKPTFFLITVFSEYSQEIIKTQLVISENDSLSIESAINLLSLNKNENFYIPEYPERFFIRLNSNDRP